MKQVAGTLRIDLAQFRELAAFAQFGSDLDKSTQAQLERGKRLTEILKQPQYQPMEVEKQVLIIWTVTNGLADDIAVEDLKRFEEELRLYRKLAPERSEHDARKKGDRRRPESRNERSGRGFQGDALGTRAKSPRQRRR